MKTERRLYDEHMHLRPHGVSPLPPHRLAPLAEACRARDIVPGIREHAPLPKKYRVGPDGDYIFCMAIHEVDAFLAELEGTGIAVGLEIDHLPGFESETQDIVRDVLDRAKHRAIAV